VAQTFSDTGLASINHLSLDFNVMTTIRYYDWRFFVNNIKIGDWTLTGLSREISLSFDFPEIDSSTGTYTIKMMSGGNSNSTSWWADGSGGFTIDIPMTLQLSSNQTPLPGAVWLLGSGLLGLAGLRRFRKS
jgi:hypothetical protein